MNDEVNRMIAEASNNGSNMAFERMMAVQSVAWEGLMRAVDRGDDQLTNAELACSLAEALVEVMTGRGMPPGEILSVFKRVCEACADAYRT